MYDEPIELPKIICTSPEGFSNESLIECGGIAKAAHQAGAAAASAESSMGTHESPCIGSSQPLVELLPVSGISSYRSSQHLDLFGIRDETEETAQVANKSTPSGLLSSTSFFVERVCKRLPEVSVDSSSAELKDVLSPLSPGH